MTVHQQINAHLVAAERNPLKREQHLTAATQHAEANGIPHFGRWSATAIDARNAQFEERERIERVKNRGATVKESGSVAADRGETGSTNAGRLPAPTEETK